MKSLIINAKIVVDRIPSPESDFQYALGVIETINEHLVSHELQPQILEISADDVERL